MPQSSQPSKAMRLKTIAAIPCFNTDRFIADVVSRAKKHVDEVIVIDDGSHDNTSEVARAAGALVITHEINRGYGESINSCFEAAKTRAADTLVIFDGDGQHNPDELSKVIAPILNRQADIVIGSRFLSGQTNMPRYRKFGIDVITFLYNFGFKAKVSDAQSGFRAFNRKVLDAFTPTEKGMGLSVEILIKAREKGFTIKEAPISCLYHPTSSSLNPIIHGLSVVFAVIRLRSKSFLRRLSGGRNA